MKKFWGIFGALLILASACAAVLYFLKKKGVIDLEGPCCLKKPEDEGDEPAVEEDIYRMDEPAPLPDAEKKPEPEKAKEPVLKSGFSAQDFKLF